MNKFITTTTAIYPSCTNPFSGWVLGELPSTRQKGVLPGNYLAVGWCLLSLRAMYIIDRVFNNRYDLTHRKPPYNVSNGEGDFYLCIHFWLYCLFVCVCPVTPSIPTCVPNGAFVSAAWDSRSRWCEYLGMADCTWLWLSHIGVWEWAYRYDLLV